MQAVGELINDNIIVKKPKDVGRFYNKSHLGKTITGDRLELSFLESVFLVGENKLKIFEKNKEISFETLVKKAAEKTPNFEIKYIIFKDLRKRGNIVKISPNNDIFEFYIDNKNNEKESCFISTFSERANINIEKTIKLIQKSKNKKLWFAVVDEEADVTYYDVGKLDIEGEIKNHNFLKNIGILLENRVIVFDKKNASKLFEKEFFGKPFGEGIQLSMLEALYLQEKKLLDIKNVLKDKKLSTKEFKDLIKKTQPDIDQLLKVYKDMKKRGMIVKTGFKFGVHFRAYTKKPDETHAEFLVHVVDKEFDVIWAEISRAVRLAHSVNKELVFAKVGGEKIDYIKFGRLRP